MKSIILNTFLVLITIIATLLLMEFVVFRYILLASDIPENYFDTKSNLVKFIPQYFSSETFYFIFKTHFKIN